MGLSPIGGLKAVAEAGANVLPGLAEAAAGASQSLGGIAGIAGSLLQKSNSTPGRLGGGADMLKSMLGTGQGVEPQQPHGLLGGLKDAAESALHSSLGQIAKNAVEFAVPELRVADVAVSAVKGLMGRSPSSPET